MGVTNVGLSFPAGVAKPRLALAVPKPIVELILRKGWDALVLQSSWGLSDGIKLFPAWPPDSWPPASLAVSMDPVEFSYASLGQVLQSSEAHRRSRASKPARNRRRRGR